MLSRDPFEDQERETYARRRTGLTKVQCYLVEFPDEDLSPDVGEDVG